MIPLAPWKRKGKRKEKAECLARRTGARGDRAAGLIDMQKATDVGDGDRRCLMRAGLKFALMVTHAGGYGITPVGAKIPWRFVRD